MSKDIVMIGAGVANVNAATKLVDNGYKGKITFNKVCLGWCNAKCCS